MITSDLMVTYLANILNIAQTDGKLDPREREVIGKLCRQLNAEEKDLNEALKKVADGEHRTMPVGRFSDKVRNLENMLLVAMVDGELSKPEKAKVLDFARKIHLNQEQIKIILAETKLKISLQQVTLQCGQCGVTLAPDSKFCTSCGNKV